MGLGRDLCHREKCLSQIQIDKCHNNAHQFYPNSYDFDGWLWKDLSGSGVLGSLFWPAFVMNEGEERNVLEKGESYHIIP